MKDGRHFSIGPKDLRDMVENFDKRKNEMLVIDYEHASEQPEIARGGPVPAAGWIHDLFINPSASSTVATKNGKHEDVLKALVEWTPEAHGLIESGKYRFFSPAIDWSARDKESGKPQGATLTSGALTNHPFLEELPPLMLTDLTAATVADGKRSETGASKLGSDKGETTMDLKRLSIRKLEDGPHAGHHAVFCGDDLVGYMTDEDFCKYAQKHLSGANAAAGGTAAGQAMRETGALSTLFAERVGASGAGLEDIRGLVEAGRLAQSQQTEASSRMLILSEVVKDGRVRPERALELARDQKISLADYVAVQSAEQALERAIHQGKILPRDRHFFFRDALERPGEFAEFVERAAPLVRLGSEGIGSGEAVPIDQEVDLGVRRLMSEQRISYGKALKALFREHPALEARYRSAHSQKIEASTPLTEPGVNAGITQ